MSRPHSSHVVWQGDSWRLRVDEFALANGRFLQKGVIEHPGSVVLVPLTAENHVLMLHQYRAALGQTILELPAGTRGWSEDWLVCAQRELREETGHRANNLTLLGEFWPAPGLSDELMRLYLATGLHPDPLPADPDEEITVQAMPLAGLLEMVRNGRILDAKTMLGMVQTAEYLAKKSNTL